MKNVKSRKTRTRARIAHFIIFFCSGVSSWAVVLTRWTRRSLVLGAKRANVTRTIKSKKTARGLRADIVSSSWTPMKIVNRRLKE